MMKQMWSAALVVIFGLMMLSGCLTVGPDYEAPETQLPDAWHSALTNQVDEGLSTLETWWTLFEDETLQDLIVRASTNNVTLKVAVAQMDQARALRGVAKSQYFPTISADGALQATRTSDDFTAAGQDNTGEFQSVGLGMGWELDVWGRVRRSVESADASQQVAEENYRDIMVLLYAEVATSYIKVRTMQERIHLAESNLVAQSSTMELTQNRFDAGLVPALDIEQAALNWARTESLIPPLRQSMVESINRLGLLLGEMPYALETELLGGGAAHAENCAACGHTLETDVSVIVVESIPVVQDAVLPGVPTDLMRLRPDIRRAERELAAQHARIGVATADFYPSFTLPGTLSLEASDIGSGGSMAYRFGPQFSWNIFAGGRIRNQVRVEEFATQAALHRYEQTVLLALEEVENSMADYANEKDRVQSLEVAASKARESVNLVTELYLSGLTDFQNVLNMEQALMEQDDALATSQGQVSAKLVQIYKALGGGWTPPSEEE